MAHSLVSLLYFIHAMRSLNIICGCSHCMDKRGKSLKNDSKVRIIARKWNTYLKVNFQYFFNIGLFLPSNRFFIVYRVTFWYLRTIEGILHFVYTFSEHTFCARVAVLVVALYLGSSGVTRGGSSPPLRTRPNLFRPFFLSTASMK